MCTYVTSSLAGIIVSRSPFSTTCLETRSQYRLAVTGPRYLELKSLDEHR